MAKPVIVNRYIETLSFAPLKVVWARIYGSRKRIAVDATGASCSRAALTADGSQLLLSGMTAQAYFTPDGRWVARSEMVGLDADGNTVEIKPSTLGVPQDLEGPVEPAEILGFQVESIFYLEPEERSEEVLKALKAGAIYRFSFNYTAGFAVETAYLVANDEGVFALVGQPAIENWVEEGRSSSRRLSMRKKQTISISSHLNRPLMQ